MKFRWMRCVGSYPLSLFILLVEMMLPEIVKINRYTLSLASVVLGSEPYKKIRMYLTSSCVRHLPKKYSLRPDLIVVDDNRGLLAYVNELHQSIRTGGSTIQ